MADKLCVCGHVMESRVTGKKIELHTADTGSLWSEFLAADLYICPWCGRMAFFEPEEARALRFRRACENKTIDQLRAKQRDLNQKKAEVEALMRKQEV